MVLNEYVHAQNEKNNFIFPPKPISVSQTIPTSMKDKSESPARDTTNLLVKFRDQATIRKSPSSNFKSSTSKLNNIFHCFLKDEKQQQIATKHLSKISTTSSNQTIITPQPALKPVSSNALSRKSIMDNDADFNDQQTNDDDIRIINEHVHEFYYAIRILPGQNPRSVFIGWVTSRFKPIYRPNESDVYSLNKLIRHCTIIETSDDGSIMNTIQRQDAYMFCAADLLDNMPDKENVARRVANGLLIGCLCDVSTGQLTFYVNGKESTEKLQVEPNTKLYPAVFVEPTVKEVLQFELGRIKVNRKNCPLKMNDKFFFFPLSNRIVCH